MLDNLVLGLLGTSTDDESVTNTKDGDGIFTDVTEPDIGQSARA